MKLSKIQIERLVAELIATDSKLKGREDELRLTIVRLSAVQPQVSFDDAFRDRLRAELLGEKAVRPDQAFSFSFTNLKYMKKIIYATAGVALLIMLFFPATYLWLAKQPLPAKQQLTGKPIAFETRITKVGADFFGRLGGAATTGQSSGVAKEQSAAGSVAAPLAAGTPSVAFGRGGGGGGVTDAKIGIMPPFELTNYRYIYKGGELATVSPQMDVLKMIKGASVSVDMANLVNGLNFGLGDLGSFSGLSLQNVNLVQKGDNGYIISVFPEEGTVSIYQNWPTWPAAKCLNDLACIENQRVREGDVPADQELIQIADNFLAAHGISKAAYGDPVVSPSYNFRILYETSVDKPNFYFPESIDVVYPNMIDGKAVYDEWSGIKQGLTVSVHVKARAVSNIYNLTLQNYQASPYEMETDVKKILGYAERGGVSGNQYFGPESKVVDLELLDPELVYIKYYNYKDNMNEELLVPAYYFPIKEVPKDQNFFRKGVVIPLAKSILAERQADVVQPDRPMPLSVPVSEDAIKR